jgi:hypothetical protein
MARGGWGQGRRVLVNAARPLTAPGVNAPSRKDLVHSAALGRGLPVFSDLAMPRPLKLMSSKVLPADSVAQIYRPARPVREPGQVRATASKAG